ncbi:hypothetical protein LJC14_02640 [Treponema sp. OttesenSCG-928-L16]|nr:hypothetical protein [Treponema sp. OttesenSCG-928-L16]
MFFPAGLNKISLLSRKSKEVGVISLTVPVVGHKIEEQGAGFEMRHFETVSMEKGQTGNLFFIT